MAEPAHTLRTFEIGERKVFQIANAETPIAEIDSWLAHRHLPTLSKHRLVSRTVPDGIFFTYKNSNGNVLAASVEEGSVRLCWLLNVAVDNGEVTFTQGEIDRTDRAAGCEVTEISRGTFPDGRAYVDFVINSDRQEVMKAHQTHEEDDNGNDQLVWKAGALLGNDPVFVHYLFLDMTDKHGKTHRTPRNAYALVEDTEGNMFVAKRPINVTVMEALRTATA